MPKFFNDKPLILRAFEGFAVHCTDSAAVIEGDALSAMRALPAGCADLIFADPPYNLSHGGSTVRAGRRVSVDKGAWDSWPTIADFHAWNIEWLAAARRLLSSSGSIWVSGTQHAIFSIGFAMQRLGFRLLNTVAWEKPNASPNLGCRQLTHSCELVIWAAPASGPKMAHVFNYAEMKKGNGGKQLRDVWTISRPGPAERRLGSHPTQKPVALLERIVRAASRPGAIVFDPFCGSGTTGVAAARLGRRFIGVDRDRQYAALAVRRIRGD